MTSCEQEDEPSYFYFLGGHSFLEIIEFKDMQINVSKYSDGLHVKKAVKPKIGVESLHPVMEKCYTWHFWLILLRVSKSKSSSQNNDWIVVAASLVIQGQKIWFYQK